MNKKYKTVTTPANFASAHEERYRLLFKHANDAILLMDKKCIIDCNDMTVEMFGYKTKDHIISHPAWDFSPEVQPDGENSREKAARLLLEAYRGQSLRFEWTFQRLDGTCFDAEASLNRIKIGRSITVQAVIRDITKQKEAQKALMQSEERYRNLLDLLPETVFETDLDGAIKYVSNKGYEIFGYTKKELKKGVNIAQMIIPEDRPRARDNIQEIIQGKNLGINEYTGLRKDGTTFPVVIHSIVIIKDSKPVGLRGLLLDNTKQKQIETALRENEEKYRSLVERANDGIVILQDEKIVFSNTKLNTIIGYSNVELTGRKYTSLFPKDQLQFVKDQYNRRMSGEILETPYETALMAKDGRRVEVELNAELITYQDKPADLVFIHDITHHKRAEAEQKKLIAIIENTEDFIGISDLKGHVIYLNRAALLLSGLGSLEGARNKTIFDFVPAETQSYLKREVMPRVFRNGFASGENVMQHFVTGQIFYMDFHVFLIKDPFTEQPTNLAVVMRDISEKKRAEEKIQNSLQEKVTLLKEIHHRVKNNMQIISSLLTLQSRYIQDPATRTMFAETQNRIRSMALIHEKLYGSGDLSRVNMKEYISNLIQELKRSYGIDPQRIRFELNIAPLILNVDQAMPCGLIINELISNAVKYAFRTDSENPGMIRLDMQSDDDLTVRLVIADNGVGIPKEMDIRQCKSLGLRLIHILSEDQLKGTLNLKRSGGTQFTITFQKSKEKKRI